MKATKTPKGKPVSKTPVQASAQKEPPQPPAPTPPEPEPQRQPTRGEVKTSQTQRSGGDGSPVKRKKTRSKIQLHTPPDEKIRKIEQAINKRTAVQDLMYRQKQLEDAVREARRVNIMIEEEKQRMRQLKQRMIDNNLAQYVVITRAEGKQWDYKRKSPTKKSFKDFHNAEVTGEGNEIDDGVPGLIPPIDERKKNGKLEPYKPPDVVFDDNYAFYMYYLNNSGQLVTPVEQMFQDNVQKQEQIKKLKEEKEKNSRVVKNTYLSNPKPNESTLEASPANQKGGKAKYASIKSKIEATSDSVPKTPTRSFLRKSQPPGDTKLKSSRDQSAANVSRRELVQTRQSVKRSSQSPKNENNGSEEPPKKFTFLKRNVEKKVAPAPTVKSKKEETTRNTESQSHARSKSTDQENLRKSLAQSRQQIRNKTMETPEPDSPEVASKSPSPSKQKFTPKFDSKKKIASKSVLDVNSVGAAQSRNGAPQILIKKSSTKEPETHEDEDEEEKQPKKKGGILHQAIAARSSLKSRQNPSLLESQDSSSLTLPPIGKVSGIKQPSSTMSGKNNQARPPLPQIKTSNSGSLQEIFPSKIPQLKQSKLNSSTHSIQLISMNTDSHHQSSARQSQRSGGAGSGGDEIDKKKEQQLKAKEFSQMVKEQIKPKINPKNQVLIELRKHSISLDQLELMTRQNPIKKVQLTDLL